MFNKNTKGFTLIELLVVIAIVGLISTLSILALNSARVKARDARRLSDIKQLHTALEFYYNDYSKYPEYEPDGIFEGAIFEGATVSLAGIDSAGLNNFLNIPKNPLPIDNQECADVFDAQNLPHDEYYYISDGTGYGIIYCLSNSNASLGEGTPFYVSGPLGISVTSCPFVHSWNGEEYTFDTELLTKRGLKEWKGKEISRLTDLKSDDGIYKLKITEELPETSYIDQLSLIRVEHDKNIEVYFDQHGNFQTLSEIVPPHYAVDDTNKDILNLLGKPGYLWNSEYNGWEGVDLSDNQGDGMADSYDFSDLTRTLEVHFEKPENVSTLKLVIGHKVQKPVIYMATAFKDIILKQGKKSEWATDGTIVNWFGSQVSTKLEVFDGDNWRSLHSIGENYAHSLADIVYQFDISDINTTDLKIRLVSLPASRGINYIYADYTPTAALKVERTFSALNSLRNVDDDELVLEKGDEAELNFSFAEEVPVNKTATYFIEATGYYEAWHNYYDFWPEYKIDITFEEVKKAFEYPYTAKIWMHRIWEELYKPEEVEKQNFFSRSFNKIKAFLINP